MAVKLPIYMEIMRLRRLIRVWSKRCCRTSPRKFGNAASRNHSFGWRAKRPWKLAPAIASLINATPERN